MNVKQWYRFFRSYHNGKVGSAIKAIQMGLGIKTHVNPGRWRG